MAGPFKKTGKVDHTPNLNFGIKSNSGNVFSGKYHKLDTSFVGGKADLGETGKAPYAKEFNVKSTDGFMSGGNPNQTMKSRGNA